MKYIYLVLLLSATPLSYVYSSEATSTPTPRANLCKYRETCTKNQCRNFLAWRVGLTTLYLLVSNHMQSSLQIPYVSSALGSISSYIPTVIKNSSIWKSVFRVDKSLTSGFITAEIMNWLTFTKRFEMAFSDEDRPHYEELVKTYKKAADKTDSIKDIKESIVAAQRVFNCFAGFDCNNIISNNIINTKLDNIKAKLDTLAEKPEQRKQFAADIKRHITACIDSSYRGTLFNQFETLSKRLDEIYTNFFEDQKLFCY